MKNLCLVESEIILNNNFFHPRVLNLRLLNVRVFIKKNHEAIFRRNISALRH